MDAAFLSNKIILIISPQSWGNMMLAKHHYAIELAKRGNQVYYLNPPDNHQWNLSGGRIKIKASAGYPNLFIIDQQLYFPYKLKFHSRRLYNILVKKQIRKILVAIPRPVDLIWSFDLGNLFPLIFFDKKIFKIFHPVDEPADNNAILAGQSADILFSVTREILEKYKSYGIPSYFINHGLAEEFLGVESDSITSDDHIKVGISGNLMRPDLDRKILLQIIHENPSVIFHFYGSYTIKQSNIGAAEDVTTEMFIRDLKSIGNTLFHGVLKTEDLAKELNSMDAFLICYDVQLDQSKGTNYHKVIEYLSTGKVIISNNITTYKEYPELIKMTASRMNNKSLPVLFRETIADLEKWNSADLINQRKSFAQNNLYRKQLDRIELQLKSNYLC